MSSISLTKSLQRSDSPDDDLRSYHSYDLGGYSPDTYIDYHCFEYSDSSRYNSHAYDFNVHSSDGGRYRESGSCSYYEPSASEFGHHYSYY